MTNRLLGSCIHPLRQVALILMMCLGLVAQAQPPVDTLSAQARVSVLTCAPGTELYSLFGHTALRIQDPASQLDWVWNYGVFEFDENPVRFVTKFARGHLKYYVLSYDYPRFEAEYRHEHRAIQEQVLNLNEVQKKRMLDALLENELPQNRYYQYDFFFDNCSTRERDLIAKALGDDLRFHPATPDDYGSYRQLIDPYLRNDVWADFGIDLLLGRPTDKIADQKGATFLPDELLKALGGAEVKLDGQWQPLVKQQQTLLDIPRQPVAAFQYAPHLLGWGIFVLAGLFTFLGFRSRKPMRGFDIVFFMILGILGTLMVLFWMGTDHRATYQNLNMLWALPTHLIFAFTLLIRKTRPFARRYANGMVFWMITFMAVCWLLPQGFHAGAIPIAMAATLRFVWMWYIGKVKAA
jgi:Domain of unknown function (DUF4105)